MMVDAEEGLGAVTVVLEGVVVGGGRGRQKQLKCLTRFSRLCCGKDAGPGVVAGRPAHLLPHIPRSSESTNHQQYTPKSGLAAPHPPCSAAVFDVEVEISLLQSLGFGFYMGGFHF